MGSKEKLTLREQFERYMITKYDDRLDIDGIFSDGRGGYNYERTFRLWMQDKYINSRTALLKEVDGEIDKRIEMAQAIIDADEEMQEKNNTNDVALIIEVIANENIIKDYLILKSKLKKLEV